ncbi:TetR/AcrR family transcriptional regulator C-terminal domain-containing protein [Micromonospora sp. NPDC049903]|uniref:TetR/AcrR family transcriptional regulator C-terminal domain-containing protein n=1 Tax=Micromonospora sp. NPDC049903 TaxID=3364276 RepID=UPI0037AC839B
MPYLESVSRYLTAAHAAGSAKVEDPTLAATQFLGMISNFVYWPTLLLTDWAPERSAIERAVEETVETRIARYRP